MLTETKADLESTTLLKLQELIQVNLDSYKGFHEAATTIDEEDVEQLFVEIAHQRKEQAEQLQAVVRINGMEAESKSSLLGAFHRYWLKFRDSLNGGDLHIVLCEAERGEHYIRGLYEQTLVDTVGSAMNAVLTKHYAEVKRPHDLVRAMRDAHATTI